MLEDGVVTRGKRQMPLKRVPLAGRGGRERTGKRPRGGFKVFLKDTWCLEDLAAAG